MKIEELLSVMSMLRDPERGCPWDLQQSFETIAPHTLEEVYEVVDAIERRDYAHLKGELGDLLFQVIFHAQLGEEQGLFSFEDIVREITEKLLHRHPHVFPDGTPGSFGQTGDITPEQVESNWERIKNRERADASANHDEGASEGGEAHGSLLDDVPQALPALLRAKKLQRRAASVGFDWDDRREVLEKLREETGELEKAVDAGDEQAVAEEMGDILFTAVNLARHLKVDPETSLRQANLKFEERFRRLESLVRNEGKTPENLTLAELDEYWRRIK